MNSIVPIALAPVVDPVWESIRADAELVVRREPLMASFIYGVVLNHQSLAEALAMRLAQKLESPEMSALALNQLCAEAMASDPEIVAAARSDLEAVKNRDPACDSHLQPLLYFKGFLALQTHRVAHWLWRSGRKDLARFLQMRESEIFGVDVHPGARVGRGVMIDHATGVVIGETAVVGDNVSMLHGVTLGGTGKESGDRHPKIGDDVLIGTGASILGNIRVGRGARVGAGSVVLEDAPAGKTVAGIPAKVVGDSGCARPSERMDHNICKCECCKD